MSFSEWKDVQLKDVVSKLGDGLHGTPKYSDTGEYYFINGNNLVDGKIVIKEGTKRLSYEEFQKHKKDLGERTILVGINGTIGNVALYNNEKCILGKSACYFNVNNDVNKQFIKYVITGNGFQSYIQNTANGTTIKNVSLKSVREFQFKLPSLKVQERIASILSSLEDKIELNRQTAQTLEAMAQALFKEICLPKGDELPDGWRVGIVADVCEVNKNTISKKDVFETIHYIEISEVNRGRLGNVTSYPFGMEPSRAKRKLKHGDIVISMVRPDRGSYFLALNPDKNLIVSTGFGVFSPTNVPFSFLYLLLTDKDKLSYYGHVADGAAYPSINPNLIMRIEVVIPPNDLLVNFHSIAEPLLLHMLADEEQNQILVQLRDQLLPKLMNNQISIESDHG